MRLCLKRIKKKKERKGQIGKEKNLPYRCNVQLKVVINDGSRSYNEELLFNAIEFFFWNDGQF